MLAQNDARFLYLALDLVQDRGNSAGVGDYFWLSFDVDGNAAITPGRDVNFGIYPSLPIRIARQYYLGPGTWTTILPGATASHAAQGFGPSGASSVPHRIWEMRIDLSELGVSLAGTRIPLQFGLRIASSTPGFTYDFPAGFFESFASLNTIDLALGPPGPTTPGPVIATVGLIPTSPPILTGGRATTAPSYFVPVQNAAFGGTLNMIRNAATVARLWGAGARTYAIQHGLAGGPRSNLLSSWTNYLWTGTAWKAVVYAPDAQGRYPVEQPGAAQFSLDNLLFQWPSVGAIPGLHDFQAVFYDQAGNPLPKAAQPPETLQLFVDNNLPDVRILGVRYRGAEVLPCSILEVAGTDPIQVHLRAFDAEGDLLAYRLDAHFGHGQVYTPPLAKGDYPGGNWQGVADTWISAPPEFPAVTCAYQLRLSATARVTNGYGYVGYTETTDHVTLVRKQAPALRVTPHALFPFGFGPRGEATPGTTPEKLGG